MYKKELIKNEIIKKERIKNECIKNELIKKELILDLAGAPFGGINPLMLTAPMCRLDLPL